MKKLFSILFACLLFNLAASEADTGLPPGNRYFRFTEQKNISGVLGLPDSPARISLVRETYYPEKWMECRDFPGGKNRIPCQPCFGDALACGTELSAVTHGSSPDVDITFGRNTFQGKTQYKNGVWMPVINAFSMETSSAITPGVPVHCDSYSYLLTADGDSVPKTDCVTSGNAISLVITIENGSGKPVEYRMDGLTSGRESRRSFDLSEEADLTGWTDLRIDDSGILTLPVPVFGERKSYGKIITGNVDWRTDKTCELALRMEFCERAGWTDYPLEYRHDGKDANFLLRMPVNEILTLETHVYLQIGRKTLLAEIANEWTGEKTRRIYATVSAAVK